MQKPPTRSLSTCTLFFARQFFYPAGPFRHNYLTMHVPLTPEPLDFVDIQIILELLLASLTTVVVQ